MLGRANRSQFATLHDAAVLNAGSTSQTALIFVETGAEPVVISRSDFQKHVQQRAAAFRNAGLSPRDLIIIAAPQTLESIFAFWGALLMGAIPSIFPTLTEKLDPEIYMSSMAQLVRISRASAIFTSQDFAPQLATHITCPIYNTNLLEASSYRAEPEVYRPAPDAIAFLQHSSGTTGLQKGVALSHRAVLNQLASYSDRLMLNTQDVIVSWLPLYHDMGLIAGFLLPLVQGIPLIIMSPFDWVSRPALLFQAVDRYKGTLCWLPNFAFNHLARRVREADVAGLSLASMRAFINCSEPARHDSHLLFLQRFGQMGITSRQLAVSYAMAENVFAVTQTPIHHEPTLDWIDRRILSEKQAAQPLDSSDPNAVAQVSCGSPIAGA